MAHLHDACEKWGFFQVQNHGIDKKLMEKVKHLVNLHYDNNLRGSFYQSEIAKSLLQDDQVPGLEFLKDGEWIQIPPSKNNTIFVNNGDQVEVLSNGKYRKALHRVMADNNGSRLSIATFYNPMGDAIIPPAPKLLYPNCYIFQDYLKLYFATKFSDKGPRFESPKKMANGDHCLHV